MLIVIYSKHKYKVTKPKKILFKADVFDFFGRFYRNNAKYLHIFFEFVMVIPFCSNEDQKNFIFSFFVNFNSEFDALIRIALK